MKALRALLCVFCCALAVACASKPTPPPPLSEAGEARWQALLAHNPQPAPSVVNGSLRFGPADDTRRVTFLWWNNGVPPLRLDVQAGVGATIARVHVEDDMVLVYLPQDKKAYVEADAPGKTLRSLGIPLPLSLGQLNDFFNGRYNDALGRPSVISSRPSTQNSAQVVYTIRSARGQTELDVSPDGLPVRWAGEGWNLSIAYGQEGLPNRLEGRIAATTAKPEQRFVLLIKERQSAKTFSAADLNFQLPEDTPVYSLDD